MEFLKKHYEKLALSLVLLALAVVAVLLFVQVGSFKESLEKQLTTRTTGKKKELIPADLSTNQMLLKQLSANIRAPLGGDHPTFNSPRWRRAANGDAVPDTTRTDQGPAGISGLTTTPLYLTVDFSKTAGPAESLRYEFVIGREFEKSAAKRGVLTLSTKLNEGVRLPSQKSDLFRLIEVKGTPAEPTELIIQLTDGNERASVATHKPYRRVMGYSAAFTYGTEKRSYKNIRVDDTVPLSGIAYKVVAISEGEVVLSAPNKVRSNIKAMPTR